MSTPSPQPETAAEEKVGEDLEPQWPAVEEAAGDDGPDDDALDAFFKGLK